MANPKHISLSQARDIPFDRLVLSSRNVRRLQADLSIEELAEDIARRTLLQSLSVRPIAGREGFYEVQAGGRRFRALERLVRQKRLARTAPIPCIVREDGLLEEDSLAENVQRVALHPLDQYRAFLALKEQGLGEEEIAARFFVTPQVVRQRLKLTSVAPKLLDLYAAAELSLDQLMAFTLTDDHARQEQVWETVQRGYTQDPYHIRRLLTGNTVRASDRRALFVGIAAYEAAGGVVLRDLFSRHDEGWLQDIALLERLVADRLAVEAETVRAEGWRWVQVGQDVPYGHTVGLRRVRGEQAPLSDEDCARREALRAELTDLEEQYCDTGEDLPEEVDRRLADIEAELGTIEDRPTIYDPEEVARAGVFVFLDSQGRVKIDRGYVRPEDEAPTDPAAADGQDRVGGDGDCADDPGREPVLESTAAGSTDPSQAEEDDVLKPLSERLVLELTAHRTLALRDALAEDPDIAFLAALHAAVLQTFWHRPPGTCLELRLESPTPSVQGPGLRDCPSAQAIERRHAQWKGQLPEDPDLLWEFLCQFDHDSRMGLLAHCISLSVNAVPEPWNRRDGRRRHADQLACAVSLDMSAAGWAPTVADYLGRVPKARILEAVSEARGAAMADLIAGLKKSDMAEQAERLLVGTGWLPEPLRTPGMVLGPQTAGDAADTLPARVSDDPPAGLPEFLTAAE